MKLDENAWSNGYVLSVKFVLRSSIKLSKQIIINVKQLICIIKTETTGISTFEKKLALALELKNKCP